jgi:hypothetical protein
VFRTNLEAVKEVVYQLRFRNIGGLIIIDLIDMESSENREKVYRALQEALRQDKAKTNILKISELGLVEMTRKRTRENLVQTLCEPCAYCEGRGYVLSRESVAFKVLREIRKDLPRFRGRRIALSVHARVAEQLLRERAALQALERELGREIEVRAKPGLHQEQFEISALDAGPPVPLTLRWLGIGPPEPVPALPVAVAEAVVEAADGDGVEKVEVEGNGAIAPPVELGLSIAEDAEEFSALDLFDADEPAPRRRASAGRGSAASAEVGAEEAGTASAAPAAAGRPLDAGAVPDAPQPLEASALASGPEAAAAASGSEEALPDDEPGRG